MKQIKFFAMLLALTFTVSLTSCGNDDDDVKNNPIVGSWTQVNDYGTVITVVFDKNLTGTVEYEYPNGGGGAYDVFEYFYDVDDRELTIIGDTQLAGIYDVTITANTLILFTFDGVDYYEYHFRRN